jgi:SHO1 osmosensor
MPSYGSQSTPSLRKMENGHGYGQRSTFSVGRIIGDPFALATISIAIVSTARASSVGAEC